LIFSNESRFLLDLPCLLEAAVSANTVLLLLADDSPEFGNEIVLFVLNSG
jgi:hypothetical protein